MFRFLRNLFNSGTYLAVDIGTASLKLALIKQENNSKPQFLNYGYLESFEYLERSNAAFQTSTLRLGEQEIAGYIKALMKESNLEKYPVVASLQSFSTFTTLLEVPTISDSEIAQSIALQARQYIPIPIEDAIWDWIKVGEITEEDGTKKTQLFLISVPIEVVAKYQRIFKLADLKLEYLEIEGLSLARALTNASTPPTLIIDIGSRSSVIVVAENGFPKFSGFRFW
jgi:Tfp pilus assembly PilM family ATPase